MALGMQSLKRGEREGESVSRGVVLRAQLSSADAGSEETDLAHQRWKAEGSGPAVTRRST